MARFVVEMRLDPKAVRKLMLQFANVRRGVDPELDAEIKLFSTRPDLFLDVRRGFEKSDLLAFMAVPNLRLQRLMASVEVAHAAKV